ncbi:ABC transporter substrate-binding protein [Amphritea sp. HPY]|uniref:ABC transporter substrate-binding protein n=1 Tax=Amphritea sp. HPY TaxID=3421652 RepID=UPI003D7D53D7
MREPTKKYDKGLKEPRRKLHQCSRYLSYVCCLIVALLISACSRPSEPLLSVGTIVWPGYEPLYLARSLGHYDNTQIKLVELTSATEVIHALRNGTLEAAALTLDEALTIIDDGFNLKIILVMDYSNGGDVLLGKPQITSLAELRGKRVAVEYSAVGAIVLDAALETGGLDASDIDIVACTPDEHIDCYGAADAIVTFEPATSQLLNQGARRLFDSSQIPGKIVDVLVVSKNVTNTHPRSLEQLLSGYFKARHYLASNPQSAFQHLAARLGVTPDEVPSTFDGIRLPSLQENQTLLGGNPAPLQQTANELASFMLEKKLLKNSLTIQRLLDDQFLPQNAP